MDLSLQPQQQQQQQSEFIKPLQMCLKDGLPPEIRTNFVAKVYSLLVVMLLVSFGIAAPFVFQPEKAQNFMYDHYWVLAVASTWLILQQMLNIAMLFEACCGGSGLRQCYFRMFTRVPINYLLLLSYAACFGVIIGFVCAQYTASSVSIVFALTASMMFALTIYAITTKSDFSGCGPFLLVLVMGMLTLGFITWFVPYRPLLERAIAVCGAVLMSSIIIFDTQLIFGTAAFNVNGHAHKLQFTIDLYAFAAYQLYLDFVNMFLYLLMIFGHRR